MSGSTLHSQPSTLHSQPSDLHSQPSDLRAQVAAPFELEQPLRVVDWAARSVRGARRRANEDAILVAPSLFAVADGVGGHAGGHVAATLALDSLRRSLPAEPADPRVALSASLTKANAVVRSSANSESTKGMLTTAVLAQVTQRTLTVAHVGDSRAYLWRAGSLRRLTADHSLVAALVERGHVSADAARQHPLRALIVRALGLNETVRPDVTSLASLENDLLLLCSDGLSDALDDSALHRALATEGEAGHLVALLVEEAVGRGGGDDISLVAARLG